MNEDAFARRFYADRAELESLRHPADRREARSTASPSRRTTRCARRTSTSRRSRSPTRSSPRCSSRSRCSTASSPTPSRCASRCSRSPGAGPARCTRPTSGSVALGDHRLAPAATTSPSAWRRSRRRSSATRRSRSTTTRWSATRSGARKVDPYHLLFQGGQFYLLGHAHERGALRVFRLSRIRGKVAYATKAEHDFRRPADFDPRAYANRADWQFGEPVGDGRDLRLRADRLAGRAPLRPLRRDPPDRRRRTIVLRHRVRERAPAGSWVLGLGEHARVLGPAGARRASSRARRAAGRAPRAASPSSAAPGRRAATRRGTPRRRDGDRRPRARPRSARSASRASSRSPRS